MRIVHVGREKTWRGGENQMRLLIDGLNRLGHESFVAYPKGSPAVERLSDIAKILFSAAAFPTGFAASSIKLF
jgi:hypothetical protein